MTYPRRYNPVEIKIKQLSLTKPNIDPDFHEPVSGKVYSSPITIEGQIFYIFTEDRDGITTVGDREETEGYFVIRRKYLIDNSILNPINEELTIKKGDIVVEIAKRIVFYKIIRIDPHGHLRGKSNTYHFYFEEVKEERGSV